MPSEVLPTPQSPSVPQDLALHPPPKLFLMLFSHGPDEELGIVVSAAATTHLLRGGRFCLIALSFAPQGRGVSHHSLHPLAHLVQGGACDVLSVQFVEGVVITALRLCEDFTLGEPLSSLSTTSLPMDQTVPPGLCAPREFSNFHHHGDPVSCLPARRGTYCLDKC